MKTDDNKVEKVAPTFSQRFTAAVVKEFGAQVGVIALTPLQQKLAQHMFIGIDTQLKALDAKREETTLPIVWSNINMGKLAIDAMHRVELGLDALIPNHISPIPYLNGKTKKYDLDLRIGYVGRDCYKRAMALDEVIDIRYELVHKNDKFKPLMKSESRDVEFYDFDIAENPFDRGPVTGGFGYIIYKEPDKNKLVIVTKEDMEKSEKAAKTTKFWKPHPKEMQYVVVVRRTTDKIKVDPKKINASVAVVEMDEAMSISALQIEEGANKKPLDIESESTESTKVTKAPKVTEVPDDTEKDDDSSLDGKPDDDERVEIEKQEAGEMSGGDDWMDE
ncbi:MAG TPA: hypothetical protein ENI07_08745 [Desulfobacterales bacterium]|nr:hypothetical protein [Desulfobacterales bacterium]